MLLSVVVGRISSAYFVARKLPSVIRSLIYRATGRTDDLKKNKIVIYSESKSFWSTWRPVLMAVVKRGVSVTYLTSADNDPVFDGDDTKFKSLVTAMRSGMRTPLSKGFSLV